MDSPAPPVRSHTRFAPSPTGELHLGHVAAMIHVWGWAKLAQATVDVRIEDHDRQRCRPEFTDRLLADLDWLGFAPVRGGSLRLQSQQKDRYETALQRLQQAGVVYACRCSRRTLPAAPPGGEVCYPGTCRDQDWPAGPDTSLRVRLPGMTVVFHDDALGRQEQTPARQCGDIVIRDRHGQYTYQFAVVVDDLLDQIDWVIRGEDLLASTGRQIELARLLGGTAPSAWRHHPLIVGRDGRKLSKSEGAPPLRELRDRGLSAADVIGLAACRVGLQPTPRPCPAAEVSRLLAAPALPE
jgi:glutamyl-Q tRNA(Asp) synthetase